MPRRLSVITILVWATSTGASTIHVPVDAPTIAAGIAMAQSGEADTVLVAPGEYHESGLLVPTGMTIRGDGDGDDRPLVDGNGASWIFSSGDYMGSQATVYENIRLRDSAGSLIKCPISNAFSIRRCDFESDDYSGCGIEIGGEDWTSTTIEDCRFTGLETGIRVGAGSAVVLDCQFIGNRSLARGGAILAQGWGILLTVDRCTFLANTAVNSGGAVSCWDVTAMFTDCTFIDNAAPIGGAVDCGSTMQRHFVRCTFRENHPEAVYIGYDISVNVTDCLFVANGSGILATGYLKDAMDPGAAALYLTGSTIVANDTDGITGTGYHFRGRMARNLIAFNGGAGVRAVQFYVDEGDQVENNNVYGNAGGDLVGAAADFTCINGNFSRDPVFCNAGVGDYSLASSSPCLPRNNAGGVRIGYYGEGCPATDPFLGDLGASFAGSDTDISYGAALADYDDDGLVDVFITGAGSGGENRSSLYRNSGAPCYGFMNVGPTLGIVCEGTSRGAAWGDFDADGDLDLFVATLNGNDYLFQNTGAPSWSFVDVAAAAGVASPATFSQTASWCDYDRDSDLDLYLGASGRNLLYRNLGDGTFTEVGHAAGVDDPGSARSAVWCDLDADSDMDLFVSNYDQDVPNALFVNRGDGTFEHPSASPLEETFVSNGAAWGDYDGDGDMDLFVTAYAGPDRLYRNQGPPLWGFDEVGASQGITYSGLGRSAAWVDYDLDGDLDLYVGDYDENRVYQNDAGSFTHVLASSVVSDFRSARTVAWGDVDVDGRPDVVITNHLGINRLLQNVVDTDGHWLEIDLHDAASRGCAGSRVRVVAQGKSQVRYVAMGGDYYGQQSTTVHFGLGDAAFLDTLEIRWPDGVITREDLASVDCLIRFERGATEVNLTPVSRCFLSAITPNPFNPVTTISFSAPPGSHAIVEIFDGAGRRVQRVFDAVVLSTQNDIVWHGVDDGGRQVASGVYLCRLRAGTSSSVRRITLVR